MSSNYGNVAGVSTLRSEREKEILEKRIKQYYTKSLGKRIISYMKPDLALGSSAGPDAEPIFNRIMVIIIGSLLTAILSTLAWAYVEGPKRNEQILVGVFSISWFIFVSFIALLFEKTRFLHILAFGTLLLMCGYVQDNYTTERKNDTVGGRLLLATTVFAAIIAFILLLNFASSRKENELFELKTKIKEDEKNKQLVGLMKEHVKNEIAKERLELEEEMKGKDATVRKQIADALIKDILKRGEEGRIFGGGSQKSKKQQKYVPVEEQEEEK